jgi:hypothetical protein
MQTHKIIDLSNLALNLGAFELVQKQESYTIYNNNTDTLSKYRHLVSIGIENRILECAASKVGYFQFYTEFIIDYTNYPGNIIVSGNLDILKHVMKYPHFSANHDPWRLSTLCVKYDRLEMYICLLDCLNVNSPNMVDLLEDMAMYGRPNFVKYMYETYPNAELDFNQCYARANYYNHVKITEYLFDKVENAKIDLEEMYIAGNYEVFHFAVINDTYSKHKIKGILVGCTFICTAPKHKKIRELMEHMLETDQFV